MEWSAAIVAVVVAILAAASSVWAARLARAAQRELHHRGVVAQKDLAEAEAKLQRSLQLTEQESARGRELEARLADRKYNAYAPMINALSALLVPKALNSPQPLDPKKWSEFGTWIAIFGSDDALKAWHNLQQATFSGAPPMIFIRLYAEFLLAARIDMGDPSTSATLSELVGVRFKDLYTSEDTKFAIQASWPELEDRLKWSRPWLSSQAGRQ